METQVLLPAAHCRTACALIILGTHRGYLDDSVDDFVDAESSGIHKVQQETTMGPAREIRKLLILMVGARGFNLRLPGPEPEFLRR